MFCLRTLFDPKVPISYTKQLSFKITQVANFYFFPLNWPAEAIGLYLIDKCAPNVQIEMYV